MATVTLGFAGPANTSNSVNYNTNAFTPASGNYIVATVVVTGNTDTGAGQLSDSRGGTYTLVRKELKATNVDSVFLYIGDSPATTVATTLQWTRVGATTGGVVIAHLVQGLQKGGLAAVRQHTGRSNVATSTPALSFGIAPLTGSALIAAIANATNPATLTPPTGWTERSDTGYATPTTGIESASVNSGVTAVTTSWGNSSSAYAGVMLELDDSAPNTGSSTLGAATSTGTGSSAVVTTGSGASTLADATGDGAGAEAFTASGATTLADATSAGSGVLVENITGSGSSTLGAATSTGSASETYAASGASTLSDATSTGVGAETFAATGSTTLGGAASTGTTPVSYVGVGTESMLGTTGTLTPTLPSGLQPGDLMLMVAAARASSAGGGFTTPTGWTLVNASGGISFIQIFLYARIYQTGDAAPSLVGTGATSTCIAQIAAFRGVDQADSFSTIGADSNPANGTDIGPITGLSTLASGAVVVMGARAQDWQTGTSPGVATLSGDGLTWAEIGEPNTTLGGDAGVVWDYALTPSATTVTSKTFSVSSDQASSPLTGFMVALRPASSTGGTGTETFTGTGSSTLGAATGTGTGSVTTSGYDGSGSSTLADATSTGTATESYVSSGSSTLGAATSTGTATEAFSSSGSSTLADATSTGTGTVTVAGVITGSGSSTLSPATSTGTGTEAYTSTGSSTLGAATSTGTGAERFAATGSSTLGAATGAGTGAWGYTSTGSSTLSPATSTGTARETYSATGSSALGSATSLGTAAVRYSATGSSTLGAATSTGAGSVISDENVRAEIVVLTLRTNDVFAPSFGTSTEDRRDIIILPRRTLDIPYVESV